MSEVILATRADVSLKKSLEELAAQQNRSLSGQMRYALQEHVRQQQKKAGK